MNLFMLLNTNPTNICSHKPNPHYITSYEMQSQLTFIFIINEEKTVKTAKNLKKYKLMKYQKS